MGLNERFEEFLKSINLSVKDAALKLGKSENYVRKLIRPGESFGIEPVMAILNSIPEISAEWLITGKGSMLKADKSKESLPVASPTDNPEEGIPLIPVSAMAGALSGEQTVLEYECDRYVVPVFRGADFLIPVKGSSMYPKYSSGDIVACKRVNMSGLFFQWGKVYVIDTDQGGLIKRIKRGSDPDHILIVSDNESYEPFELPLSSVHSVAIVLGVIRLE